MNFVENLIMDTLPSLTQANSVRFSGAMKHSLTVDPMIFRAESFAPFGFDQRQLYNLKVLLLRPLAYTFIRETGSMISQNALDKRTSLTSFQAKYGREPSLISVRPRIMILTYTEWLGLAFDKPPAIALPELLQDEPSLLR